MGWSLRMPQATAAALLWRVKVVTFSPVTRSLTWAVLSKLAVMAMGRLLRVVQATASIDAV
ncbi:hypothetical protein BS329_35765 [Amycolatopsis coloradensis]|uniref:Uncharacterized protein n=2 Tax=Amycolatopsis coloradensis TaxID=76021 RepID=A0A1R0KGE9_9PSEU|nr:hypothetical protein BS329_35765 [Amycolatopsis coloradensis]